MSTIAAYLRVSSRGQDVATQRDAIQRMARARGDRVALWFEDSLSGAKLARPQLRALRQAVHEGRVRKLYVFKLDRLGRSGIRDTLAVVQELRSNGCELASVTETFPLEGPVGEIVIAAIAWAAQMERQAIGDRIAAARIRVEASGGRWGRPRRVDPGTLATAKAMFIVQAKSIREISAALKIPRSTIADALSEKGHYKDRHPGIAKTRIARRSG